MSRSLLSGLPGLISTKLQVATGFRGTALPALQVFQTQNSSRPVMSKLILASVQTVHVTNQVRYPMVHKLTQNPRSIGQ